MKKFKSIIVLCFTVGIIFSFLLIANAENKVVSSGKLGDNISYTFSYNSEGEGVLTIKGTGALPKYTISTQQPLNKQKINKYTERIVVEEGITEIPASTFSSITKSLKSVSLPSTLTMISLNAFNTYKIPESPDVFKLVDNIYYIDDIAIYFKEKTPNIGTVRNGTRIIAGSAFSSWSGLRTLNIPASVKYIGRNAVIKENISRLFNTVNYYSSEYDYNNIKNDCNDIINVRTVNYNAYPEHTHDYHVESQVAPTCTEAGYEIMRCSSEYGDGYKVDIPATGHSWDEPEFTWSDDLSSATATRICQNDNTHTEEATVTVTDSGVTLQPGCETLGEHTYTATAVFPNDETAYTDTKTVSIPATGHKQGSEVIENETAATCEKDGGYDTVVYCTVCGKELSRNHTVINAIGHNWDNGKATKEADCENEGELTYTCLNCGMTRTEVIPATGHKQGSEVIENETAATCEKDGGYDTVVYCTVCGKELSRNHKTVNKTGHSWKTKFTWNGYSSATATRICNNNPSERETVTAVVSSEITKQPTETEYGTMTYSAVAVFSDGEVIKETKNERLPKKENSNPGDSDSKDEKKDNVCKYCGRVHTGVRGKIAQFFHNIFYFFKSMFRRRK